MTVEGALRQQLAEAIIRAERLERENAPLRRENAQLRLDTRELASLRRKDLLREKD